MTVTLDMKTTILCSKHVCMPIWRNGIFYLGHRGEFYGGEQTNDNKIVHIYYMTRSFQCLVKAKDLSRQVCLVYMHNGSFSNWYWSLSLRARRAINWSMTKWAFLGICLDCFSNDYKYINYQIVPTVYLHSTKVLIGHFLSAFVFH